MKAGDYARIKPGVHDDRMPKGRRDGMIVEVVGPRRDQVIVMFSNSAFLKFHKSQVEMIVKIGST